MRSLTSLLDKVCGPLIFALEQRHLENLKQITLLEREKEELQRKLAANS